MGGGIGSIVGGIAQTAIGALSGSGDTQQASATSGADQSQQQSTDPSNPLQMASSLISQIL